MTELTTQLQQQEKKAQLVWTGIILSFFLIQAIIWIVAISITANDRSHSIVADYDQKALYWDEEIALRNASAKLGWQTELRIDDGSDIRGDRTVTLKLLAADHTPVTGATVEVKAFHRAVASQRQPLLLAEINDGVYAGTIRIRKSGLWQFDGIATRDGDTFLIHQQQHIKAGN